MGLADWFASFCATIQVQDGGTISARYRAITKRLNTDFWSTTSDTSHSLYVGSYGRNTAIQGFSDLDMVFELPSALYQRTTPTAETGSQHCFRLFARRCRRRTRHQMSVPTAKS